MRGTFLRAGVVSRGGEPGRVQSLKAGFEHDCEDDSNSIATESGDLTGHAAPGGREGRLRGGERRVDVRMGWVHCQALLAVPTV